VQRIANLRKYVRRDRVIACNCMENRKQLFADYADATQRRSPKAELIAARSGN
jgi:hypothetical protein